MQLSETLSLPVPLAEAWDALNDLSVLEAAIPGCEALVQTGDDAFDADMALTGGPLKPRFTAHVRRADVDAPNGCTLLFDASTLAGSGSGRAVMRLRADGDASTLLSVDMVVRIDGGLAQFGGTLVDVAARRIATEFFARFSSGLDRRHARLTA